MERFYGIERDPNGTLRRLTLLDAKVVTQQVNDDGEMIYTVAVPAGVIDSGDAFSIGFCRDDDPETCPQRPSADQAAAGRDYMERYHGWMQGGDRSDRDQHWYAKGGLIPSGSRLATNGTGKPEEVWAPREDSAYLPLPREGVVPEPLGDPEEDRHQLRGDP